MVEPTWVLLACGKSSGVWSVCGRYNVRNFGNHSINPYDFIAKPYAFCTHYPCPFEKYFWLNTVPQRMIRCLTASHQVIRWPKMPILKWVFPDLPNPKSGRSQQPSISKWKHGIWGQDCSLPLELQTTTAMIHMLAGCDGVEKNVIHKLMTRVLGRR